MRILIKVIIVILGVLVSVSCKDRNNEKDIFPVVEVDLFNPVEEVPVSSFIDTLISVRLELPKPLFFGVTADVLFADTNIYVHDSKQEIIFRFNSQGNFLNMIGKLGNGPGEFSSCSSCFLNGDTVFVSDLDTRRIFSYTQEGNFINVISFPFSFVYEDIVYLPNGEFLCHRLAPAKNNRGIWIMNKKGEKSEVVYANEDVYPYIHSSWNTLSMLGGGLIGIYEPPTGNYYSFNTKDHSLKKVIQLRANAKMLGDFKGIDSTIGLKEEYSNCSIILNTDNYIFSLWVLPGYTSGVFSLYSKEAKKMTIFKKPLVDFPGYFSLGTMKSSNLPNTLVTILTDEYQFDDCPKQYKNLEFNERVMIVNKWVFK